MDEQAKVIYAWHINESECDIGFDSPEEAEADAAQHILEYEGPGETRNVTIGPAKYVDPADFALMDATDLLDNIEQACFDVAGFDFGDAIFDIQDKAAAQKELDTLLCQWANKWVTHFKGLWYMLHSSRNKDVKAAEESECHAKDADLQD